MLRYSSRLYTMIVRLQLSPLEAVGLVHVTKRLFIMTNNTAEKCIPLEKLKSEDQFLLTVSSNTFILATLSRRTYIVQYFELIFNKKSQWRYFICEILFSLCVHHGKIFCIFIRTDIIYKY
jgi:hypothetical protein